MVWPIEAGTPVPVLPGRRGAHGGWLDWTDERVELLKTLWAGSLSAAQIADELGGISRNAVIGKARRLGLEARSKKGTGRRMHKAVLAAERPLPMALPAPTPKTSKPRPDGCSLLELTQDTCRWPLGDPQEPGFCFCGHLPTAGTPYCKPHARMAYNPKG